MKTLFKIFLIQREPNSVTKASIAVTVFPLVFKYNTLLRKAITKWSSGVLWHNTGLELIDIPFTEIPLICKLKGKLLLNGSKHGIYYENINRNS